MCIVRNYVKKIYVFSLLYYYISSGISGTMAALTGLMAGSLRALWPWKTNYEPKAGPMTNTGMGDDLFLVIVAAAAGALTVAFLAWLERRIERAEGPDTVEG